MSQDMRRMIDEFATDTGIELKVMDGYDDCIVGICQRFNDTFVVYDRARVIQKLMADGMTFDEAMEFHEFNQLGAWVGAGTPAFLDVPAYDGELE